MNAKLLPLFAGIAAVVSFTVWTDDAKAQVAKPAAPSAPAIELPVGLRCVVTLDPQASDKMTTTNELLRSSGFTDLNTTEGVLVRMDHEWVVLRDGNYDNWIPRGKVLLLRASR